MVIAIYLAQLDLLLVGEATGFTPNWVFQFFVRAVGDSRCLRRLQLCRQS